MSSDLAKFFTGLATSLLGAVAFYLSLGREKKIQLDAYAKVLVVFISVGAVLSIFFGHLWSAGLHQQLISDAAVVAARLAGAPAIPLLYS